MGQKLIIEIHGGVLSAVHSTEPVEYFLVDHDNLSMGDAAGDLMEQDYLKTEEEMQLYIQEVNNKYHGEEED